jgi:hypothetical protein
MKILQFVCSGILVMTMASCANKTETVETSATTPATTTASSATPDQAGFKALQSIIGATKTAVEAGKLDVAKTEIAKFYPTWKPVEDGVKAKSPENYKAIESGVEEIEAGITKNQSKDALLASLQKLSQNVDKAGK